MPYCRKILYATHRIVISVVFVVCHLVTSPVAPVLYVVLVVSVVFKISYQAQWTSLRCRQLHFVESYHTNFRLQSYELSTASKRCRSVMSCITIHSLRHLHLVSLISRNRLFSPLVSYLLVFAAVRMKSRNSGWGFSTVLEYSGWNCVPTYHLCSGISTISTSWLSSFLPLHLMPFASYISA